MRRLDAPVGPTRLATILMLAIAACHSSPSIAPSRSTQAALPRDADFLQYRWIDEGRTSSHARFADPQTGEPLALSDTVWLDVSDIDSAWAAPRRGDTTFDVVARHSRAGAARAAAATATHIGHRTAIVIDGRVQSVVTILGAIGVMSEPASGLSRHDADSLARRIEETRKALAPYQPVHFRRSSVQAER